MTRGANVPTLAAAMICPSCRQDVAPIVRGVRTYCTSCGALMPLTAAPEAVNLAGQPAKVGGGIVKALGSLAIFGGFAIALFFSLVGLFFKAAFAFYVGGFFAVLAALIALPLFFAGRKLQRAGEDREHTARARAVLALAAQRRGVLTVSAVARALEMSDADADALLTQMAKDPDGRVALEVDDNGNLTYVFRDIVASAASRQRVQVDGGGWRVPDQAAAPPQARVVDAELIDEDADAESSAKRMRR